MRIFAPFLLCFFAMATTAMASDRAREKRWADEILPQLVVGEAVMLKSANGAEFLGLLAEAKGARTAIVLAHGVGVHPDHGLIGQLRTQLADQGFTTLAIQMPIAAAEAKLADYYPALFPEAGERLASAGGYLRGKGYTKVALLAHSMGAWMANVYLDRAEMDRSNTMPYSAWITLGVTGRYTTRMLGMDVPLLRVNLPLLDLYGGADDRPGVLSAADARASSLEGIAGSRQVRVDAADHLFARKEPEVVTIVSGWLRARFAE